MSSLQRSSLHAQSVRLLTEWVAPDADQETHRRSYVEFLHENPLGVSRENRVGHITASALVMDEAREHVLLTLHPKVGRWLQLGGHVEPDDRDLRAAATREVHEECGLATGECSLVPVQLDRHPVPCGAGPLSEHLDVQFLYLVPQVLPPVISNESDDLRWFPLKGTPDLDQSVRSLIERSLSA